MNIPKWLIWLVCLSSGCIILVIAFFLIWCFSIARIIPGASDYTTKLPNGYYLMRQYSGSSMVFKEDNHGLINPNDMVGPSEYGILMAVSKHYIVGNLDTEEKYFKVPEVPDRYFIIDTSKHEIMKEMSFEEYEKKIRELGFTELPKLIRPNKLTRFIKK